MNKKDIKKRIEAKEFYDNVSHHIVSGHIDAKNIKVYKNKVTATVTITLNDGDTSRKEVFESCEYPISMFKEEK